MKKEPIDYIQNRENANWPTYDTAGIPAYCKNLQNYFNDHVPFKNIYIKQSNQIKGLYLDSYNSSNKVLIGKEGWLFYNACLLDSNGMNEYAGYEPWSDTVLLNITKNLKALKLWCDKNKILFEVIICPNKQSIYPEYLPDIYTKQKPTRLNQLTGVYPELINFETIFNIEKKKHPKRLLYYKTDSHWNQYGACIAVKELYKKAVQKFTEIDDLSFIIRDTIIHYGLDLANMMGLKESYSDRHPILTFKNNLPKKIPHLTIVHDSYIESMEPSLNRLFEKISKRHLFSEGIPTPQELLNSKTDMFVIELVERYEGYLYGNFHPDYYR